MILVCCYALLRGKREGMIVGFFAGLLIDLYFGYFEVIGINAFLYLVIGYIVGIFHEILYLQDILISIITVTICDFIYNFVYYIITFFLKITRKKLSFAAFYGIKLTKCNFFFDFLAFSYYSLVLH